MTKLTIFVEYIATDYYYNN